MRNLPLYLLPLLLLVSCQAPGALCTDCAPPPTDCAGCLPFEVVLSQHNGGPGDPQPLDVSGVLRVAVVGFDRALADATATVVAHWGVEIDGLPFSFEAALAPELHDAISPSAGDPSTHTFYLEAWVDVDGDGELCAGDLEQATGALDTIPPQDGTYPVSLAAWEGDCVERGL